MVKELNLCSAFLVFRQLKALYCITQVKINLFTHICSRVASIQKANLLIRNSFTRQWNCHLEQFGVQCVAQGHFNMQTGGVVVQTNDPLIGK